MISLETTKLLNYFKAYIILQNFLDKKQIDLNSINEIILSSENDIDPTLYGAYHNAHNIFFDTKQDQFKLNI